jgi:ABC-type branched-subunit amino acid transport system permease subunit
MSRWHLLNMCIISAIMALGVNIQWGYAGLFNVGTMGFAALGGLAAMLVSVPPVAGAWQAGGVRYLWRACRRAADGCRWRRHLAADGASWASPLLADGPCGAGRLYHHAGDHRSGRRGHRGG